MKQKLFRCIRREHIFFRRPKKIHTFDLVARPIGFVSVMSLVCAPETDELNNKSNMYYCTTEELKILHPKQHLLLLSSNQGVSLFYKYLNTKRNLRVGRTDCFAADFFKVIRKKNLNSFVRAPAINDHKTEKIPTGQSASVMLPRYNSLGYLYISKFLH